MKHNLISVHSCYSVVDGFHYPEQLAKFVSENSISSYLPLSDLNNLFGFVKHYRACQKHSLKPIYGIDFELDGIGKITLIAKNNVGFNRLKILASKPYENFMGDEGLYVKHADLLGGDCSEDLALFLDQDQVSLLKFSGEFNAYLQFYDLYCKLDLLRPYDAPILNNLRVVPSIDVYFQESSFKKYHDCRVAIQEKALISGFQSPYKSEMCFHSEGSFTSLVDGLEDLSLFNVEELYKTCEVEFTLGEVELPEYRFTDGLTESEYLKKLVYDCFAKRKEVLLKRNPKSTEQDYLDRIKYELEVIIRMGFAGYFLIVWDYISWAKSKDIMVGPGRGSGAGSMVAFMIGIVDLLDPLKYDLLFERFLNPDRVSMPDFDTDFDSARRSEVIEYARERHGYDRAILISTFGKIKAKSAIKDAGRVLEIDVAPISALMPNDSEIDLITAIDGSEKLQELSRLDEYSELFEVAFKLEGLVRSVGKHAAGVVVSKTYLTDYSGVYTDKLGNSSIMLDMHDAEDLGLVKFDFLALSYLTIIHQTMQKLHSSGNSLDLDSIPLDDPATYALMCRGLTKGTFQLASNGMRKLIKQLKPDCFEDVIALVALFRPGPLQSGMVDNYVNRKHGLEAVAYPDKNYQHSLLEEPLKETYGIILYQEQVMKIAQVFAGYSLGSADILRRAMGKKKPEEMEKQHALFVDGATVNGVDSALAEKIFDLVEKFSGYGFNKSHSAAYGLVAYQTLFLKANYPAIYMAQVLTNYMADHTVMTSYIMELSSYNLSVIPPDINLSNAGFEALNENQLVFGLVSIKGLATVFANSLVKEREDNGVFVDLQNFVDRMTPIGLNKTQLACLVFSGALDSISELSDSIKYISSIYDLTSFKHAICIDNESKEFNQTKLCGVSFAVFEKIEKFSDELRLSGSIPLSEVGELRNGTVVLCGGLALGIKVIHNKVSRLVGELKDSTGAVEIVGWSQFIEQYEGYLQNNEMFLVEAVIGRYNDKVQLTLKRCWNRDYVRQRLGLS